MYKRQIDTLYEHGLDLVEVKRSKKEPLNSITDTFTNGRNINVKSFEVKSNDSDNGENTNNEIKMDCENVENQDNKKDSSIFLPSTFHAAKYNSICDRDRRRHMYF